MKFIVVGWPSLRAREVAVVRGHDRVRHAACRGRPPPLADARPAGVGQHRRRRCPSAICIWPSRSIVARTCSEPGVTRNGAAALSPCALACSATSAARLMSSYEELVQLPISAVEICVDEPVLRHRAPRRRAAEIGRARSGECGPTMCGSSFERSSSTHAVVILRGIGLDLRIGFEQVPVLLEQRHELGACRSRRR